MPRLKKKDRIISLANKIITQEQKKNNTDVRPSIKFVERLIKDSEDGFIHNYSQHEIKYVNELFRGNYTDYLIALNELLKNNLITKSNEPDVLFIKPFSQKHFTNLVIYSKNHIRKYLKNITQEKESLNNRLFSGKYGIISKQLPAADTTESPFSYTEKTKGFIVPVTLFPYLTGEPLPEEDVASLLKHNRELLALEEKRRDLNKEDKRVYCACMAFSDRTGVIKDYNINSLVECIKKDFGMRSFATATVYNSINKLIDLNLISEYIDSASGQKCLRVERYNESLEQEKSRYVIIPNAVFNSLFKKLYASAVKLFFYILERLNNGENNHNYEGQNKAFYFKFAKLSSNDQETKDKYTKQLVWLRKRYDNELDTLLFGDIEDSDFFSLAEYFHFFKNSETSFQVRVRHEYFISKRAYEFKQLLLLKGKHRKKAEVIEDEINKHKIDCKPKDIISIIKILKHAKIAEIRNVIDKLNLRIKEGKDKGWEDIRSIPAYIYSLYKDYCNAAAIETSF